MKAKLINESSEDILTPKSEDNIISDLKEKIDKMDREDLIDYISKFSELDREDILLDIVNNYISDNDFEKAVIEMVSIYLEYGN
jgi:glutamate mutase epsilon subunit